MEEWYPILGRPRLAFLELSGDPATRREPYYGCWTCIPSIADLPPNRVRLLQAFPGPTTPTPWRSEPPAVWELLPKALASGSGSG